MTTNVTPLVSTVTAVPQVVTKERLLGIDALRGIAILVMALDHAASFVRTSLQAESYGGQPAILENWTHWVSGLFTNLAAPTFWFLSGVSLALFVASRRRRAESSWATTRFLLTRASVLILLDLTICRWAWAGQGPYLQVLLSIGLSLALISVVRLLPLRVLLGLGLTLLFSYQLLLPIIAPQFSETNNFWLALLLAYSTKTHPAVEYSLFGWFSLMLLGFVLGHYMTLPALRRAQTWLTAGLALLSVWFVLRLIGGFGDLTPYSAYTDAQWYYFLIMNKTPPSLTYLTFNLGIAALVLAMFFNWPGWLSHPLARWLAITGQVSLFVFVVHIVVYSILGQVVMALGLPIPSMIKTYVLWVTGLIILVPLALVYRSLKQRYPQSVLRYL